MESRNTPSPRKMPRAFVARHLDIQAFAEEGASLAGKEPLSHYPRLAAEDLDPSGTHAAEVVWEATGRMARQPSVPGLQAWVHLKARAHIRDDLASHADCLPWVPFDMGTDPGLERAQRLFEQAFPRSPGVEPGRGLTR